MGGPPVLAGDAKLRGHLPSGWPGTSPAQEGEAVEWPASGHDVSAAGGRQGGVVVAACPCHPGPRCWACVRMSERGLLIVKLAAYCWHGPGGVITSLCEGCCQRWRGEAEADPSLMPQRIHSLSQWADCAAAISEVLRGEGVSRA